MAQPFQKAALALLFCAPSTLHEKWRDGDVAGTEAELNRLGLSDAAKEVARISMGKMKPKIDAFMTVAALMGTELWAGGEPHPPDDQAVRIAQALRAMDGE